LTNQAGGLLVDVLTGRPLSSWKHTKRGLFPMPAAATSALFDRSGSRPPSVDLESGSGRKLADALTHQGRWNRTLTPSPDGTRLLAEPAFARGERGGDADLVDGHLEVVDFASGKTMLRAPAESGSACAAFSPDSRRLIAAEHKRVTLWDLDSAKALWSRPQPAAPADDGAPNCLCLAVSPDGKTAFLDSAVIDLASGAVLNVLAIGFQPLYAEFSPDSERIFVAGSAEGPGKSFNTAPAIWHARRGVRIRSLSANNAEVLQPSQVAWSPDGRWVLLEGKKGPMLFDVATGQPIPAFAGHDRWWSFDEQVEALLLARRLHRQIPALRDLDFYFHP
jgi:WD40 repeat protein